VALVIVAMVLMSLSWDVAVDFIREGVDIHDTVFICADKYPPLSKLKYT
jgi:hypothetical protein